MVPKQVAAGCLLLGISLAVFAEAGVVTSRGPLSAAAGGAVALSVGSLLFDAGDA